MFLSFQWIVVGRRARGRGRQQRRAVAEGVEEVGHRLDLGRAVSSVFIRARNASPPGRARTAQPMCLRALRTPVYSPCSA